MNWQNDGKHLRRNRGILRVHNMQYPAERSHNEPTIIAQVMKRVMKHLGQPFALLLMILLTGNSCGSPECEPGGLKNAFRDKFYVGAALNLGQINGKDSLAMQLVEREFNSITAENIMKWEAIHPKPGVYDFEAVDRFVEFGEKNGMFMVGHTLVWHYQTPAWVFQDDAGNPTVRDTLLQRMRDHIFTVMGRYKGRVQCWDVVNETMGDDGQIHKNRWTEIIGEDFVQKAFEYAREADPGAILVYNDYNLTHQAKREGVIRMVKELQENGVEVDAIGLQGHYGLDWPSMQDLETSILAYSELGTSVMITELDVDVLPRPTGRQGADLNYTEEFQAKYNPYTEGLPDSVQVMLADRYAEFFKLFVRHADKVDRVTLWGVHDGQSWLNSWPIRGRTNYPLLFDRQYQPKHAYESVMKTAAANEQ